MLNQLLRNQRLFIHTTIGINLYGMRLPLSRALEKCTVPVLFIHGSADSLVPYDNLDKCYTACASKKLRSSYAGAPHISSFGREPRRYLGELEGFIRACTE